MIPLADAFVWKWDCEGGWIATVDEVTYIIIVRRYGLFHISVDGDEFEVAYSTFKAAKQHCIDLASKGRTRATN